MTAVPVVLLVVFLGLTLKQGSKAATTYPTSPPSQICGNHSQLDGPTTAPAGAVTVPAGDNSSLFQSALTPNTTYYFASGTHTLGTGQFSQIQAAHGDTLVGAPGAIIDGQHVNQSAINPIWQVDSKNVTVEYLTIQHFRPPGLQGAVNGGSADSWTITHNTMQDNAPGSAVYLGTNDELSYNCLTRNGEEGWGAYSGGSSNSSLSTLTGGPMNVNIDHNEISFNNTCNWEAASNFNGPTPPSECAGAGEAYGCGCAGGGKFWQVDQATFNYNYDHDNYDVGAWADTDNVGIDFEGNWFENDDGPGVMYEISYNVQVKNNTFIHDDWLTNPGSTSYTPNGAVFISNAGSDSRLPGNYNTVSSVNGNYFQGNSGGVIVWDDSGRFCGASDLGHCTLVNKTQATQANCSNPTLIKTSPYLDDCRWKTQNVSVTNNVFNFNPADLGAGCTTANACGLNGIMSEYGTYPSWSPYTAYTIPNEVTNTQNNVFANNTYNGPWHFMTSLQGNTVDWTTWRNGWTYQYDSSVHSGPQDAGSTFNPAIPTPLPSVSPTPTPSTTATPPPGSLIGDLNNDKSVGILDLSILLSNWGTTNSAINTNLGETGPVGVFHLSVLLSHWGQTATTSPTPSPTPVPTHTPTPTPSPTPTPVSTSCTNPVWSSADPQGTWHSPDGYVVQNDMWNGNAGPQTIYACSANNFYVVSNQTNQGGQVKTYPDVGALYNGNPRAVGSYSNITSSFGESIPALGEWDAAYDIWTNNWSHELMIWNNTHNHPEIPPAGSTAVTIDGIAYHEWNNGSTYIAFMRDTPVESGTVNILHIFQWLESKGLMSTSDTLIELEYGVEISATESTPGVQGPETFQINNWSLTAN